MWKHKETGARCTLHNQDNDTTYSDADGNEFTIPTGEFNTTFEPVEGHTSEPEEPNHEPKPKAKRKPKA